MKTKLQALSLSALFLLAGCATDIVGKAEQGTHIAAINFEGFVSFERDHEAQLLSINPQIHVLANKLRHKECGTCLDSDPRSTQNGIRWLQSARTMTDVYESARTPENKINMQGAIAIVQGVLDQITQYFLDPRISSINPATAAQYQKTKIIP